MMPRQQRIAPAVAHVRPMVQTITSGGLSTMMPLPQAVRSTSAAPREADKAPREADKPPSACTVKVKVPAGRYKYSTAICNGRQGVYLTPISDNKPVNPVANQSSLFVPFKVDSAITAAGLQQRTHQPSILSGGPLTTSTTSKDLLETKFVQSTLSRELHGQTAPGNKRSSMQHYVVSSTPPGIQLESSTTKTVCPQYPNVTAPANLNIRPALNTSRPLTTVSRSEVGLSVGQVREYQPRMNIGLRQQMPIQPSNVPSLKCQPSQHPMAGKLFASAMKSPNSLLCSNGNISSIDQKCLSNICPVIKTEAVDKEMAAEDLPFKIESVFSLCAGTGEKSFADLPQVYPANNMGDNRCRYHDNRFVVLENLDMKDRSSINVRSLRKFTGRRGCSKTCREITVRKHCQRNKLSVSRKTQSDMKTEPGLEYEAGDSTSVKTESTWETEEDPDLLREFEQKELRYKPAPKFAKFKKFKHAKLEKTRNRKSKPILSPNSSESKKSLNMPHSRKRKSLSSLVKQENVKYPKIPDNIPMVGAGSLGNSTSNESSNIPTSSHTQEVPGLIPTSTLSIDPNSAAFQQIVAAMGTKKFYLMKIEGKHILIPTEQKTDKPRAYMLSGDKTKTTTSLSTVKQGKSVPVPTSTNQPISSLPHNTLGNPSPTVSPSCPTSAASCQKTVIKTEPSDTGYEQQAVRTTSIAVSVKEEPAERGYPDELPATMLSAPKRCCSIPSTSGDSGPVNKELMMSEKRPETTSEERINRLKQMLREREKQLEEIRVQRKNKPALFHDMNDP